VSAGRENERLAVEQVRALDPDKTGDVQRCQAYRHCQQKRVYFAENAVEPQY
jgi:hypothetical protein